MININEYFFTSPGSKAIDKIDEIELNEILLNSMLNGWIRQKNVQVFYCESITKNKSVDMFECIQFVESIDKGVVESCYKTLL